MTRSTPLRIAAGLALAALIGLGIGVARRASTDRGGAAGGPAHDGGSAGRRAAGLADPATRPPNAGPGIAYVGDGACVACHREISASFRDHPMGRSLAPIRAGSEWPGTLEATFEADGREYGVSWRDGELVHSEAIRDAGGNISYLEEATIRYALGSGARGVSFLHVRDGGALYQSPISWYTQEGRHDLAPGYHRQNRHFERPIYPDCLYCHSGRYQARGGPYSNEYGEPIFLDHAISCERCHGPGSLHVDNLGLPDDDDRPLIVNPADLSPTLRESVCQQCHMGDRTASPIPGRSIEDYRPGLSLLDFVQAIQAADEGGGPSSNQSVDHVGQMAASRCFRESDGRMGCISCHDPHRKPDPAERVAFYRDRCLSCHGDPSACALPEPQRLAGSPDQDCTACHMPPTPLADIAHTATTLHWIPRIAPGRAEE